MAACIAAFVLCFLPLTSALASPLPSQSIALVVVNASSPIAQVNDDFICANLDWWPPSKCDYGTCSWANSSLLNLDLENPLLQNAVKAFTPLKIRLGGTLQDRVVYNVGSPIDPCLPFQYNQSDPFTFSGGCLPATRWDELNHFFQQTGSLVVFGLNVMSGRHLLANGSYTGDWNATNAQNFIEYTVKQGYDIQAWEFGNELDDFGLFGKHLSPQQCGPGVYELHMMLKNIYASKPYQPMVAAPDGPFRKSYFQELLQTTGPNMINVVTHHVYNLGSGNHTDMVQKIFNVSFLDEEKNRFQAVQETLQQWGPWTVAWVGEGGGSSNSGRHLITDAFISGFWYLDQLGIASTFNTKTYCRQSLVGGNYGLLNTTTFHPNPDYYSTLLWHRLMGRRVLSAKVQNTSDIRAYAHCSKHTKCSMEGVTIVLINLSGTKQYNVTVEVESASTESAADDSKRMREEYHLTAEGGDVHAHTILLNGEVLEVVGGERIPEMVGREVSMQLPIAMAPHSYAFVSVPGSLPACA